MFDHKSHQRTNVREILVGFYGSLLKLCYGISVNTASLSIQRPC